MRLDRGSRPWRPVVRGRRTAGRRSAAAGWRAALAAGHRAPGVRLHAWQVLIATAVTLWWWVHFLPTLHARGTLRYLHARGVSAFLHRHARGDVRARRLTYLAARSRRLNALALRSLWRHAVPLWPLWRHAGRDQPALLRHDLWLLLRMRRRHALPGRHAL